MHLSRRASLIGLDFMPEASIGVCTAEAPLRRRSSAPPAMLPLRGRAGDSGCCFMKHKERNMARLTDTQLIVLSKAAAREDGIAMVPDRLNKAAAAKVAASLVSRKLMREVRSKPGMPAWRDDDEGRGTSLVITQGGRQAIGIEDEENQCSQQTPAGDEAGVQPRRPSARKRPASIDEPRVGSKQALIIKLLTRKSGVTLETMIEATGWMPHTTRAALTGLRKRGYAVLLERQDGKPSLYRIASAQDRAAG